MSRIGNLPVELPPSVEAETSEGVVSIKGPKGQLELKVHPSVEVVSSKDSVMCVPRSQLDGAVAQLGTARSLLANMVEGVSSGFSKELILVGVGYRAQIQESVLRMTLGYSHPIVYGIPEDVEISTPSVTRIVVRGIDKQRVGQVAADIRSYRPPEPYKGKGVRYIGEHVARKEAKKKQ